MIDYIVYAHFIEYGQFSSFCILSEGKREQRKRDREREREGEIDWHMYVCIELRSFSLSLFFSMSILFTTMSRLPILSPFLRVLSFLHKNKANILLQLIIILHNIIQMMLQTTEHDTQANLYEYTHMQIGSCHKTISSAKKERKRKLTHLEKGQ